VTTPLVVVGAGGFGRETIDVILAINRKRSTPEFDLLGVVDSHPSPTNLTQLELLGVPWLGTVEEWLAAGPAANYVIGIGNPVVRDRVVAMFAAKGLNAATLIHPAAVVGSLSVVGVGSVVCAGAQISTNVALGDHVHVNPSVTIGHDSKIFDFASINPGAIVSGDVIVGSRVLIGAGAVVLQGLRIGDGAVIGASACVVKDVGSNQTVKGVPAR
jgi:sugar O-acyltransferase (sialic acid O-acetyltransferase NeuD family)